MKILQVITSLRTGGAERMVAELTKRMAGSGDDVELLLLDGTRTPLYDEMESSGIKVHSLGMGEKAMHNPLLAFRLRHFLKKHAFDVVHAHNSPCQYLVALASPRQIISATTEHGTVNRRRAHALLRPLDRWMYSRYRSIVCVSEETRDELSQWLDDEKLDKRMSVVLNGIDLDGFKNASPAPDVESDGRFRILMVSAFRPEKDQMTLIKAMGLLPDDCELLLAGGAELPAHKAIMDSCKKAAEDLGLGERVRFLGYRDDVPALLAASDMVVLSSLHEGLPLSALEAMASGRPFVASDVSGLRDIVRGAGILFPCGDAERLAQIIGRFREDRGLREGIAASCRKRAEKYDIAKTVEGYRSIYEQITR